MYVCDVSVQVCERNKMHLISFWKLKRKNKLNAILGIKTKKIYVKKQYIVFEKYFLFIY